MAQDINAETVFKEYATANEELSGQDVLSFLGSDESATGTRRTHARSVVRTLLARYGLPKNVPPGNTFPKCSSNTKRGPLLDTGHSGPNSADMLAHVGDDTCKVYVDAHFHWHASAPEPWKYPSTPQDCFQSHGVPETLSPPGVTTLIVRNIPRRGCNVRDLLLNLWNPYGSYNLLYVPFSSNQRRWAHYAFVNCVSHKAAAAFRDRWEGWRVDSCPGAAEFRSGCETGFRISAANVQGLEENLRLLDAKGATALPQETLPVIFDGSMTLEFQEVIAAFRLGASAYNNVAWGAPIHL